MRTLTIMSVKNLWFKKFRSFLTIGGVIIGIGSIFLLVAFGLGLQHLVQQQIIGSESINTVDVNTASQAIKLDEDSLKRFSSIQNVQKALGEYTQAGKLTLNGASADIVTYGVDQTTLKLLDLKLISGKFIDTTDTSNLLINNALLQAAGISKPDTVIGQEINLSVALGGNNKIDKTFTITRVICFGSGS